MIRFPSFVLFSFFCLTGTPSGYGQDIQPDLITTLENEVAETSGLIIVNDRLITHNDSGGKPVLYEINTLTGNVTRAVTIKNATNIDWEDICRDDEYIYIGDFGNNSGTRQNLVIYKVRIADYLSAVNDIVNAETIHFSYAGQTYFEPDLIRTPYDAEALINLHDSLYIFTKNHTGIWSDIYPVTKRPGTYVLHKSDSINTGGLITGAAYDGESNSILLTGYNQLSAFIIEVKKTTTMSFSTSNKIYLILEGSEQVESIYPMGNGSYLITSEGNQLNWPALLRFRLNTVTSAPQNSETDLHIYPNPATTTANIPYPGTYEVEIISMSGLEVSLGKAGITDVSSFKPGSYLIRVKDEAGKFTMTEKLIIR